MGSIVYVVFGDNHYPTYYVIFTIYQLKFGMGLRVLRGTLPSVAMILNSLLQMVLCYYCKKVSDSYNSQNMGFSLLKQHI